jgi:ubiquinone/menaquinone biosynthesis C-methylase UbiE
MKVQHLFRGVNVAEEREFERTNVERKRERYLKTNPMDRFATDPGYRIKVERMRAGLHQNGQRITGLILDIGGNTAGEATILQQEGFNFVVGDINEVALEVSRARVAKFGLQPPGYVALDVHHLPFASETFSAVTVIEALHHFPDYPKALGEIHRVLQPGGTFYSYEPNALNPLRRLSEIRDRLRGTVETSFYSGQVTRLCQAAGFQAVTVTAVTGGKSVWKMEEVPVYRRSIARWHGYLQAKLPKIFGPLMIQAQKAGALPAPATAASPWQNSLRSPLDGSALAFDATQRIWKAAGNGHSFPDHDGIPVLIPGDERKLNSQ